MENQVPKGMIKRFVISVVVAFVLGWIAAPNPTVKTLEKIVEKPAPSPSINTEELSTYKLVIAQDEQIFASVGDAFTLMAAGLDAASKLDEDEMIEKTAELERLRTKIQAQMTGRQALVAELDR